MDCGAFQLSVSRELRRALSALRDLGIEVEVLDEAQLEGANGICATVAQGSCRAPRVVILKWMGGSKEIIPLHLSAKASALIREASTLKLPAANYWK